MVVQQTNPTKRDAADGNDDNDNPNDDDDLNEFVKDHEDEEEEEEEQEDDDDDDDDDNDDENQEKDSWRQVEENKLHEEFQKWHQQIELDEAARTKKKKKKKKATRTTKRHETMMTWRKIFSIVCVVRDLCETREKTFKFVIMRTIFLKHSKSLLTTRSNC